MLRRQVLHHGPVGPLRRFSVAPAYTFHCLFEIFSMDAIILGSRIKLRANDIDNRSRNPVVLRDPGLPLACLLHKRTGRRLS